MTATIITFPDAFERHERDFVRSGSTSHTLAVEEGHALGGMFKGDSLDRPAYLKRVAALGVVIAGLATWHYAIDDVLPIKLFSGMEVHVSLRDAPTFLRD